ncbi:MAG: preprotein translocase subunit SecE [Planctomycetota bacterium]
MSYRKKEGRYARMIAFWSIWLLVGYGCFHGGGLADNLNVWMGDSNQTYIDPFPILGTLKLSTCIALGVWAVVGIAISWVLNRKVIADTLIDTEAEMTKVSWPTWTETWHGTLAVAVMVVVLLIFLVLVDLGLAQVMEMLLVRGEA